MFDKQLKEKVDLFIKFVPLVVFSFYALGFLVWNIYLSFFGVFEYNFFQTRYLSSGIYFLIISFPVIIFIDFLCRKVKKAIFKNFIVSFVSGTFLIIYTFGIFPWIPQAFGGAKSIPASLIGSPDQIGYLEYFGIRSVENAEGAASVETMPVCVLYQNQDFILIGLLSTSSRAIYLKKDQIRGFQVRGGIVSNTKCPPYKFYGL
jgi:hypothetical protein